MLVCIFQLSTFLNLHLRPKPRTFFIRVFSKISFSISSLQWNVMENMQTRSQRELVWNTSVASYWVCQVGQITYLWHAGFSRSTTLTLIVAIPFFACALITCLPTHSPWTIFESLPSFSIYIIWLHEQVISKVWGRQIKLGKFCNLQAVQNRAF